MVYVYLFKIKFYLFCIRATALVVIAQLALVEQVQVSKVSFEIIFNLIGKVFPFDRKNILHLFAASSQGGIKHVVSALYHTNQVEMPMLPISFIINFFSTC